MTMHELLFDSSPLLDDIISIDNISPWVRVYVYNKLALEMTVNNYFTAELNSEIIYELLNTAMRAGQESVSKGVINNAI
jgi:hypothetical protein